MVDSIDRVGKEKVNNKGLLMKIIKYKNCKNIEVLFSKSGNVVKGSYVQFTRGNLQDLSNRVGKTMINNQGLSMTISKYRKYSDIEVLFFESSNVVKGNYGQFKRRTLQDPEEMLSRIGKEGFNNSGQKMKIIKYTNADDIEVQFEESSEIVKAEYSQFKKGWLKDPSIMRNRLGKEKTNNAEQKMKIIKYTNSQSIEVLFLESGNTVRTTYGEFKKGSIADNINRIGLTSESNNCGKMEIIGYINAINIEVKFLNTGNTAKTSYSHFKKGVVNDLLAKTVYHTGFIGIGKYIPTINNKATKAYQIWYHMLVRCYGPHTRDKNPSYIDARICKEWHNYQNFAKWYEKNFYQIPNECMCLDKDLTKKGNKIYAPEFCNFVPNEINVLLTKRDSLRGDCPIGVCFHKASQKYTANLSVDGARRHLGSFLSKLNAFYCYKTEKEKHIKVIANRYKEWLPVEVYNYLMNYVVEITD